MSKEQATFRFDEKISPAKRAAVLNELIAQHLLVVGQTGSGKTTTTLSLLNRLQQLNQTTIVLDPTGEYAQLPNVISYQLGNNAYLEPGTLSADELQEVLRLKLTPGLQNKLEQAINALRIQYNLVKQNSPYKNCGRKTTDYQHALEQLGTWATDYDISQLFNQLIEEFVVPYPDDRANYQLLGQQYDRLAINRNWGLLTTIRERIESVMFTTIFDTRRHPGTFKTELNFILKMFLSHRSTHRTLVIDLSVLKDYEESQRALISFLMKKILKLRLRAHQELPVNIVIDEAHRYLPQNEEQLADNGIFQVLREGRKLFLKVILTTQSPLDLPAPLRSQFSNVVIHRLVDDNEINCLGNFANEAIKIKHLPVGDAYLKLLNQEMPVKVALPSWP